MTWSINLLGTLIRIGQYDVKLSTCIVVWCHCMNQYGTHTPIYPYNTIYEYSNNFYCVTFMGKRPLMIWDSHNVLVTNGQQAIFFKCQWSNWGRSEIDAIVQMTYSKPFLEWKCFDVDKNFTEVYSPVQLTIFQHCSDNGLVPAKW